MMAKKEKKKKSQISLRQQSCQSRWTRICLGIAFLFVVSAFICSDAEVPRLGEADPKGFVYWFLLFCSYPVLEVISIFNILLGLQENPIMIKIVEGRPVFALMAINLFCTLTCWYLVRSFITRKFGIRALRAAVHFGLMVFYWGLIQLSFFAIYSLWQDGGFSPLHQGLKEDTASISAAIEPDSAEENPEAAPLDDATEEVMAD